MSDIQVHSISCGDQYGVLAGLKELPLSPISCWQMGAIPSAHVLPGALDLERFQAALKNVSSLYPVIGGRLRRRKGAAKWEYFFALTAKPITLTVETTSASSPPFPTAAVIQPSLLTFVDYTNSASELENDKEPLFKVRITNFADGTTVLGLCWAHILGDAHTFSTFSRTLSKLYEGATVGECEVPTFAPHVALFEPSPEVLLKWEIPQLWPSFALAEAYAMYGKGGGPDTELVQVMFTATEVRLLKTLAHGKDANEWVSEQDGLSSYFINLLRLAGERISTVVNSVNYRNHFPNSASFPPNLPSLVANVAQMHAQSLPPPTSTLSLSPVAVANRHGLELLKRDPPTTLEWLSCRAYRMQQTIDAGEMQCVVPGPGECVVNSNWRYDWNIPFGFPASETAFHTSFATLNFLRVFRTNAPSEVDGERGAECTWRVKEGLATRVLEEIARDRKDGWLRWRGE